MERGLTWPDMALHDLLNGALELIEAYPLGMLVAIEFHLSLICEHTPIGNRPAAGANGKTHPTVALGASNNWFPLGSAPVSELMWIDGGGPGR